MEERTGKRAPLGKGIVKGRASDAMLVRSCAKLVGCAQELSVLSAADHGLIVRGVPVPVKEYGMRSFYKDRL